ncbi:hypothetical protein [Mycetohabitans endofungorum]|uniref:Uncharacterized protein n=1 Tax=Mycetohabitans endofungorum TaxID=417203 RepID=A0A2P5K6X5_9BURK|nr:hypothetical protein B0O95_1212 [Mycetohabitans endofungorum]
MFEHRFERLNTAAVAGNLYNIGSTEATILECRPQSSTICSACAPPPLPAILTMSA